MTEPVKPGEPAVKVIEVRHLVLDGVQMDFEGLYPLEKLLECNDFVENGTFFFLERTLLHKLEEVSLVVSDDTGTAWKATQRLRDAWPLIEKAWYETQVK